MSSSGRAFEGRFAGVGSAWAEEAMVSLVWTVMKREPIGRRTSTEGMTTSSARGNLALGKAWRTRKATEMSLAGTRSWVDGLTWDNEGFHEHQAQDGKSGVIWTITDDELAAGEHKPGDRGQRHSAPASEADCIGDAGGQAHFDEDG